MSRVSIPAISLQANNTLFKFENPWYCSYSCCRPQFEGTDHVYINKKGKIEFFNPDKAVTKYEDVISRGRIRKIVVKTLESLSEPKKSCISDKINECEYLKNEELTYCEVERINKIFSSHSIFF